MYRQSSRNLRELAMSMHEQQLQVLRILRENLHTPQPQLVPTSSIAREMDIKPHRLHLILKNLNGMGLIQTNPDLHYSLITREGLAYLGEPPMFTEARL